MRSQRRDCFFEDFTQKSLCTVGDHIKVLNKLYYLFVTLAPSRPHGKLSHFWLYLPPYRTCWTIQQQATGPRTSDQETDSPMYSQPSRAIETPRPTTTSVDAISRQDQQQPRNNSAENLSRNPLLFSSSHPLQTRLSNLHIYTITELSVPQLWNLLSSGEG